MTNEQKQLLFKDLCERLPYGVIVDNPDPAGGAWDEVINIETSTKTVTLLYNGRVFSIDDIKPYLRPMSSMTEEEQRELQSFFPGSFGSQWLDIEKGTIEIFECPSTMTLHLNDSKRVIDFFNSHHIDYLGFIEDGLALEAPEGMYEIQD